MSEKTHQLLVIMFSDVAGYSTLMAHDQLKALELLQIYRDIQKPLVKSYQGQFVKELGDGFLISFSTATNAIKCAHEILKESSDKELKLRVGIHLGEVVEEGGDIFGDGVNLASRLHSIAAPGGICISESVYESIRGMNVPTSYLGEFDLKGVDHPVKIYAVKGESLAVPSNKQGLTNLNSKWTRIAALAFLFGILCMLVVHVVTTLKGDSSADEEGQVAVQINERSIAVVPFRDMSAEGNQEWFTDGVTEEVLNHLVKIEDLMVISSTSAMMYKASDKSYREIGTELGVTHILEGSVRKQQDLIRITVQLIEVESERLLWSDSFDRRLDDIFAIQSEVAQHVASSLQARVTPEIQLRIEQQPTLSTNAHNLYLEAQAVPINSNDNLQKSIRLLEEATC
jgi:TolB-like protein/class 3 adenylate cyclase